jgi:hypothetical protein
VLIATTPSRVDVERNPGPTDPEGHRVHSTNVVWEALFLLLVLKIPIVYLCLVVWWAIKAEPHPEEGAGLVARVAPTDPSPCEWRRRLAQRPVRRPGPQRGPSRPPARTAFARAGERR